MTIMGRRRGREGESERWHGEVGRSSWGLTGVSGLGQVPVQLRRNREAVEQSPQPGEKVGPLLARDGEPHPEASSFGDQIGPHQKDQVPDGPQPPLKPAGREHGLAEPHQEVVEDTAGSKGRIGGVERLETARVEAQVLSTP